MTEQRDKLTWAERRRLNDELAPRVSIHDVRVRPTKVKKGHYEVVIRGFGFRPWAAPPLILVDDERMVELEFSKDGTSIRGLVGKRPASHDIQVDLGYARARWTP